MQCDNRREDDRYRGHGELRADQQPARVDDVGQRAGGQGQEKHRQRGCDLDRRHHHRIWIETGHQPVRRRVEHRKSDVRRRTRDQDDRERQIAENAPAPIPACGRVRIGAGLAGQQRPQRKSKNWTAKTRRNRRSNGERRAEVSRRRSSPHETEPTRKGGFWAVNPFLTAASGEPGARWLYPRRPRFDSPAGFHNGRLFGSRGRDRRTDRRARRPIGENGPPQPWQAFEFTIQPLCLDEFWRKEGADGGLA